VLALIAPLLYATFVGASTPLLALRASLPSFNKRTQLQQGAMMHSHCIKSAKGCQYKFSILLIFSRKIAVSSYNFPAKMPCFLAFFAILLQILLYSVLEWFCE
jgi:hypothetical protein